MEDRELHAFAKELAEALGWKYDLSACSDPADGRIRHFASIKPSLYQEFGVNIRVDHKRENYFQVAGRIPSKDKDGQPHWTHSGTIPTIHVRIDRGVAVVAREVKNRLLPLYNGAYAEARKVLDGCNEYIDHRDHVEKMLAPFGTMSKQRHDVGRVYLNRGGVAAVGQDGVDLEIRVSPELAVKILRMAEEEDAAKELAAE